MTATIIWNFFKNKGLTDAGCAGLLGNIYAESGLNPKNLQNSFEKKLNMTDESYTWAVDDGSYTNFIHDGAGFGICQWTFWSRKQTLQQYASKNGKSIGDLQMQLDFLFSELSTSYKNLLALLKSTNSVQEASNAVLFQFEKPADQSEAVQKKRAKYSQNYYDKYAKKEVNMKNSSLATYTRITNNKTTLSSKTLNRITIHCFVGQVTAKQGVDYFATTQNKCSANYVIGYDGSIGCSVDEKDRAWTSSSSSNDKQAITIEVACEKSHPYAVTDNAITSLINLIVDICQRNGKTKVIWLNGDKEKTLAYVPKSNELVFTLHRFFANKACPGQYLLERHASIANEVNKRLGQTVEIKREEDENMTQEQFNTMMNNWIAEQAKKDPGTWSAEERAWAERNGLVKGDSTGKLMWKKDITREEMVVLLYRALHRYLIE